MSRKELIPVRRTISEAFIQETIEFWERKVGVRMTPDEAEEAIHNVADFFRLLARMDREQKANVDTKLPPHPETKKKP